MDEILRLMTLQLRDAHSAEKQALRAMARMTKKASASSLKEALQQHIKQSEGQVERLVEALDHLGAKPGRVTCEGMRGIIEEGQGELEEHDKGPLLDVVIVAAQQRMEHYEIASYGTMVALARAAGEAEVATLLEETLREEKETDARLSALAERELNPTMIEAYAVEEEDEEEEEQRPAPANENRRGGSGGGRRRKAA
jgi:ferritin-like metal-binding protein YciE